MSDTATPEAPDTVTPADLEHKPDTSPTDVDDDADEQDGDEHKSLTPEERVRRARNQSQKLRDRLKDAERRLQEAEPLVKKAKAAEEANKTEIQKANELAAQWEKDYNNLQTENLQLTLAGQYGIPHEERDLIGSGSREEMEARAARLGPRFATSEKTPPPPSNRPVEGLRPGASPEPPKPVDTSYPAEWGFQPPRNQ